MIEFVNRSAPNHKSLARILTIEKLLKNKDMDQSWSNW